MYLHWTNIKNFIQKVSLEPQKNTGEEKQKAYQIQVEKRQEATQAEYNPIIKR